MFLSEIPLLMKGKVNRVDGLLQNTLRKENLLPLRKRIFGTESSIGLLIFNEFN